MKRIRNPTPAMLPFEQDDVPALEFWTGITPDGTKAECLARSETFGTQLNVFLLA